MKTLAEISFEYIYLCIFGDEDQIDSALKDDFQQRIPEYLGNLTDREKSALSEAARETKTILLSEPDQYGFTPKSLVSDDQKDFLDLFISGEIFEQFEI